mgnify:CR=1 FL=1
MDFYSDYAYGSVFGDEYYDFLVMLCGINIVIWKLLAWWNELKFGVTLRATNKYLLEECSCLGERFGQQVLVSM